MYEKSHPFKTPCVIWDMDGQCMFAAKPEEKVEQCATIKALISLHKHLASRQIILALSRTSQIMTVDL